MRPTTTPSSSVDVAIVGAGLAGLVAALNLARGGYAVALIERAKALGGRAASERRDGFHLDRGPRALYAGGPAERGLRRLGIEPAGARPPLDGEMLVDDRRLPLPSTPWRLLTSPALPGRARWQVLRTLMALPRGQRHGRPLGDVLAELEPAAAAVLAMFVRLATYCHPVHDLDAGLALGQLAAATRGVRYLDGGWQSLVDALSRAADAADKQRIHGRATRWTGDRLLLSDGRAVQARAPLVAAGPRVAATVYDAPDLADAVPVRAACLTVALDADAGPRFVLGRDAPLYLSVASRTAALTPDGAAVVHLMRSLAPDERGADHRATLEALLDRANPAWRGAVRHVRWMPEMVVAQARPTVHAWARRPTIEPRAGCFVAGDWVGCEGWLADAAVASAEAAATAIAARLAESIAA